MKAIKAALIAALLSFPVMSLATTNNLLAKREERRQERLSRITTGVQVPAPSQSTISPRRRRLQADAIVTEVQDGNVLGVRFANDKSEEVRILGIEAPRFLQASDECYATKTQKSLENLLLYKPIQIERDDTYQRDSLRRLVRYVRFHGKDVGAWELEQGLARVDADHEHERSAEYAVLEQEAQEDDRGLWSYTCSYEIDDDELFPVSSPN